ncbi:MAG: AMP-binding protein [Bacteroidota bacterium]
MTNIVPKLNIFKIEFLTKDKLVIQQVNAFIDSWNDSNDFILTKTSGSTGLPKEIKLEKKFMLESAKLTGKYFEFKKNERIVLSLSAETIGGKMQILRAMIHEMEIFITDNSRNPLKDLELKADFISLVPLQVEVIITENKDKLLSIKNILIGGAKINSDLEEKIKNIKTNFFESYGMTETLSHVALRRISSDRNENFKALNGISFSQIDSCLVIHAPIIGVEKLLTNDVVELISSSEFSLKGRKDFVINSGGYKFHPEILENKIAKIMKESFFIIGEKNAEFGEIVTFYLQSNYSKEREIELNLIFKTTFEKYEIPKRIYFVNEFSQTESGKINRLKTQEIKLKSVK